MLETIITMRANSDLDYLFDWAPARNGNAGDLCSFNLLPAVCDWLEAGEQITSFSLQAAPGLTIHGQQLINAASSVVFFADAQGVVVGQDYPVVCSIETDSLPARKESATIILRAIGQGQ